MTDIAELGIRVDSSPATKAAKELDALTLSAGKADTATSGLGQSSQVAGKSISGMDSALQKAIATLTGLDRQYQSAASSAKVFEAAIESDAAAFDRLRASIDPLYAASMQYADAIDQIAAARMTGVASEEEAAAAMAAAERFYLGGGRAVEDMGAKTGKASYQSRMLAMQLSQVAQQASATGNFTQALAIQLPDMAMGFGAAGIAAGVLASVALPALMSALQATGMQAISFSDAVDQLGESVETLRGITDSYSAKGLIDLKERYGEVTIEVLRLLEAQREQALFTMEQDAATAISALVDQYGLMAINLDAVGESAFLVRNQIRDMSTQLGLSEGKTRDLVAAFQALDAAPLADKPRILSEIRMMLDGATGNTREWTVAINTAEDALRQANAEGAKAGGWLATATAGAVEWANALWGAAQAAAAARGAENMTTGNADWTKNQFGITLNGGELLGLPETPAKAGSGGGGAADPFATDLQALIENLRSAQEIEAEWYQESLAILNDQRAQEILGKQEHDAALIALHEEYQRRIAEIDAEAQQRRLSDAAGLFGALASVAQAGGQRTAKIAAVFGAVEGTINAYGAALKALNTPGISVAGRFAAYASVLAAGLKGVASIRAAGGIGGGGSSTGTIAAQGVTTASQQRSSELTINVDPNALMTASMWSQIFEGVVGEAKARGMDMFSGIRFI